MYALIALVTFLTIVAVFVLLYLIERSQVIRRGDVARLARENRELRALVASIELTAVENRDVEPLVTDMILVLTRQYRQKEISS